MAPNQVKQIAGRAGRYGTAHEAGLATTLQARDHGYLLECMQRTNEPLAAAGLLPTAEHVVQLAAAFPSLGLPAIVELYREGARLGQEHFLCFFRDLHHLALVMEAYRRIPMRERFQLACAPVKTGDAYVLSAFRALLKDFDEGRPCLVRAAVPRITGNPEGTLRMAESVYRSLDLYLWLATHFPHRFLQAREARERREACGAVVDKALEMICQVRQKRRQP